MAARLTDQERARDLANAVKRARALSKMTQTAAIAKAAADPTTKVGKTRWIDVENAVLPLPDVSIIGRMAEVLDVDPEVLLSAAGFERASFDFVVENDDGTMTIGEIKRPELGIADQLRGIRVAIDRLAEAYQQLSERLPTPRRQPMPQGSRARRTTLRAAREDQDSRP